MVNTENIKWPVIYYKPAFTLLMSQMSSWRPELAQEYIKDNAKCWHISNGELRLQQNYKTSISGLLSEIYTYVIRF